MGGLMSRGMEETMNKQFEKQVEMQKIMMERQIENMNWQREQQMAMAVARSRDLFHYWGAFYGTALFGCAVGFMKTKKPAAIIPLVPLTFVVTYFGDLAYGDKMHRIRAEAQKVLKEEQDMIDLPVGMPTIQDLDMRRLMKK